MLFLGQSVRAERQLALCSFLLRLLSQIKVKEDVIARHRTHFRLAFGACERLHITPHTRDFAVGCCAHAPPLVRRQGRCIARPRGSRCRPPSPPTAAGPWRTPAIAHRGVRHCGSHHAEAAITTLPNVADASLPGLCALDRSIGANRLWQTDYNAEGVAVGSPEAYMSDALRRSLTTRSTDCIAYDCAAHARRGAGVPPPPFLSGKRRPSTLARSPLCTCAFELRWPKRAAMG